MDVEGPSAGVLATVSACIPCAKSRVTGQRVWQAVMIDVRLDSRFWRSEPTMTSSRRFRYDGRRCLFGHREVGSREGE
jgi:hypothetical protein